MSCTIWPITLLAISAATAPIACAQPANGPKPLDPKDARAVYTFAVRPGADPFSFRVRFDEPGVVSGVAVFRDGESKPFQLLPSCRTDIIEPLTELESDEG